jgi:hypothetical protein
MRGGEDDRDPAPFFFSSTFLAAFSTLSAFLAADAAWLCSRSAFFFSTVACSLMEPLLLTRDGRRRRGERRRPLPRPHIVEVHCAAGAAEAPGDGVVGARRLVRRVEGAQVDALLFGANLGVEAATWPRANTTVAGGGAAAGRHPVVGDGAVAWEVERRDEGRQRRSDTRSD